MPTIVLSIDGIAIKEVPLAKERTTLGRRPYNDVVVDNLTVSGEHAVLLVRDGGVEIEDLASTNGTYVNGQRIQRQALKSGDMVEIGIYSIRLMEGGEAVQDAVSTMPLAPRLDPAASVRVLTGPAAGREVALRKVVTTIGKPGVAVASITRRHQGYVLAQVEGGGQPLLNGAALGGEPVPLKDGDRIGLAGVEMEFVLD